MIDTHAHMHFSALRDDLAGVLARAKAAGVTSIINVASDIAGAEASIQFSRAYAQVYATAGIHPHDAQEDVRVLRDLLLQPKVVAVGECGLDYFRNEQPVDLQKKVFEAQIELAVELKKPLIIHNREADNDVFERLQPIAGHKVVYHCYSRPLEYTRKILDAGFYISFTGIITFQKDTKVQEIFKYIPLDRIMLETDCPFLAPVPYRGKTNEPSYLPFIAQKVAELKGISVEEVVAQTTKTAQKFFGISV